MRSIYLLTLARETIFLLGWNAGRLRWSSLEKSILVLAGGKIPNT
jgi:hypothetical protein